MASIKTLLTNMGRCSIIMDARTGESDCLLDSALRLVLGPPGDGRLSYIVIY